MAIKKFATFIIILGFIVTGYGGYKLISLYKACDEAFSTSGTVEEEGRTYVRIFTEEERQRFRKNFLYGKRSGSIKILVIGGISIFIGIVIMISARMQKMQLKNLGIILCVLGGAVGAWVFTRLTSVVGKLHSWEPPFTEYETTTIIGACIAVLLIIIGLISLTKKKEPQSDYVEKDEHLKKIKEKTEDEKVEKREMTEKTKEKTEAEKKLEAEKAAEIEKKKIATAKREAALREEYKKKEDDDFLKY